MTPDELRAMHFAFHALGYAVGFVLLIVLPWAASGRSLRIPAVEVGRWEPRRGSGNRGSEGGKRSKGVRSRSGHEEPSKRSKSQVARPVTNNTPPSASSCPVPDRDADDAVAACRVLGFARRESEECVRELRGQMPDAGCGDLVRKALSRLGRGGVR